jgi:hypothetical protein
MAASSSSSTTATTSMTASIRYQRLLECIPMALEKCYTQLNVEDAIRICYGESEGNDIFCTMLRSILQQYHIEVTNDMISFLQQNDVKDKLYKLETIVRKVKYDITQNEKAFMNDKESALAAIQHAKLSTGVSPQDVIQYRSYQQMMLKKKRIQDEINRMEQSIQQLQIEKDRYVQLSNTQVNDMNNIKMELEQSADLCSLLK